MGLQVPFPPYLLAFFFLFVVTVTIYFRETQTSKVDKTKQNKQFLHWGCYDSIAMRHSRSPYQDHRQVDQ